MKYSGEGWEHITEPIVHLGLVLTDMGGRGINPPPPAPFLLPASLIKAPPLDPVVQKVIQIGHNMLLEVFQAHEIVRDKILEEVATRVVTRADNVHNYFELLSKLSQSAPQALLNALPKVRGEGGVGKVAGVAYSYKFRSRKQWSTFRISLPQ